MHKIIHGMETNCYLDIKNQEKGLANEIQSRQEFENSISGCRQTPDDFSEVFKKVLEKSIYDKALDKAKNQKKKDEDEKEKSSEVDYLQPILEALNFQSITPLQKEQAQMVKNEALKRLKERLLTRAEIIQKRLEAETKALENAFKALKKKADSTSEADQFEYEQAVAQANFKIEILTERAAQHYRNSLTKFTELDTKLMNDPRLVALKEGP